MGLYGDNFDCSTCDDDYLMKPGPLQSVSSEHLEAGTKCHKCGKPAKWYIGQAYAGRVYLCGKCAAELYAALYAALDAVMW